MATTEVTNPFDDAPAVSNLRAISIFPWKGRKENQLSFGKNVIISVKKQGESWWAGEIDGRIGWFPKSYVRLIRNESVPVSQTLPSVAPVTPVASSALAPKITKTYRAVFAYEGLERGELSFSANDLIVVTREEGDWWEGQCKGATGTFPKKYVRPM